VAVRAANNIAKSLWTGFKVKSYYKLVDLSPEQVNNTVDKVVDGDVSYLIFIQFLVLIKFSSHDYIYRALNLFVQFSLSFHSLFVQLVTESTQLKANDENP
jgi:hypothetical protein